MMHSWNSLPIEDQTFLSVFIYFFNFCTFDINSLNENMIYGIYEHFENIIMAITLTQFLFLNQ